jgi:peptidoglycan-associated lipoprotein
MKSPQLTHLIVLSLAVTLAAGCKPKPPGVTNLHGGGQTGSGGEAGAGQGGKLSNEGGAGSTTSTSGIPQGEGHPGWPENADQFKSDTVYFDFDSSVVRANEKSKIAAVADFLKSNSKDAVKIAGHCDERGTEEYNRALGERRALALREELAGLGIEPTRIDTISFGKDRPADPGHDEGAWGKNRRGEFILLTPP